MHLITELKTTYNGRPNGVGRSYPLASKTVAVGPSASGKSTLLASLGLLLTGHADDAIGRQSVAASNDLQLAMDEEGGQTDIEIRGVLGGGDSISYRLAIGKSAAPYERKDPWRHPVRALRDILAKGTDSARAEMAPLLLGSAPVEIHRVIPKQFHHMVPETATLDELYALSARIEADFKSADKRKKALELDAAAVERVLPARPAPEALEALRRLKAHFDEARRGNAAWTGVRDHLQSEFDQLTAQQARLFARATALVEEVKILPERPPEAPPATPMPVEVAFAEPEPKPLVDAEQTITLRAYGRVLSFAQPGICPCCKQGADTVRLTQTIKGYTDAITKFEADHAAWCVRRDAAHAAYLAEVDVWRAREAALVSSVPSVRVKADAVAEYRQIEAECAGLPMAIEQAKAKLDAHLAIPPTQLGDDPGPGYEAAANAEVLWTAATTKNAELVQAREIASANEQLAVELTRVLDLTYQQRVAAAAAGINRWLPKGHHVDIRLHAANGRRIFRLGLRTPEGLAMNPSGGQRLAVLMALAVWLVEQDRIPGKPGATGPVIIMPPEERALSAEWLGKVMNALADAPAQIVIVNMVKPTGYRGKAWTTVDLKTQGAGSADAESGQGALLGGGSPGEAK